MANDKKTSETTEAPAKEAEETTSPETTKTEKKKPPPAPPLESAARRLERLLGGGATSKDAYSNPSKVVKRWLGTSSGAAGNATLAQISSASSKLLDPQEGPCSDGRTLLLELPVEEEPEATSDSTQEMDIATEEEEPSYLTMHSAMEVESWLLSLAIRILWKDQKFNEAFELAEKSIALVLNHLDSGTSTTNKSSLFPLLARLYRYRSLVAESLPTTTTENLRQDLVRAHGAACLRRDVDTQATLLNLILRDLLTHYQVEQARKLLANANFPETASNNQLCRYLYHSGRIQALRLEYTSAYANLSQCLRKAPSHTGLGFRIAAQRLLVVVQLLMGEIPDRHVFYTKDMASIQTELAPYLAITQAVRRGDLVVFRNVVSQYASKFQEDGTHTLISRLAHVVVKAGLRKLHISYSRISLQDVADRLGLPSAASAEFVVMKAVRDGVLDATIHHEEGYVQSHDLVDVYATTEPAEAFHRRIAYCLTTHNDAVRGMRYPPDAYKKQLEASRGGKKNGSEDKTDEEMAQELEEEMEEDEF